MLQWLRISRSRSTGPHCRELMLVSRYQPSLGTPPAATSTVSLSTIAPYLTTGNPGSSLV